jgi:PAS domain S-box-containing protein
MLMSIFVFDLVHRQREFLVEAAKSRVLVQAQLLAAGSIHGTISNDLSALSEIVGVLAKDKGIARAMVTDTRGRVLANTEAGKIGLFRNDQRTLAVLSGAPQSVLINEDSRSIEAAAPIVVQDRVIGWAWIARNLEAEQSHLAYVTHAGLVYTAVAILIGTVFAFLLARIVTRQLRLLLAGTERIAANRLDQEVAVTTYNEVGQVTRSFNDAMHKLSEQQTALRESETQFRRLANAIPQLCWMANADGWIFWYNERWYEYTGTTPEQMEGWGWQSVHNPDTLPKVLERWKASLARQEPFDMVFPLRGADGVFRPFLTRIVPIKDMEGKVVRWFGTNTDVTDLRDAQEALRASEQRWSTTLRSIGDAVIATDANGRVMFMNEVAERLTGWPLSEAQGSDLGEVFNIINEVTRSKPESPVAKVIRLGQIVGLANHTALISRNGTELPIEDSGAPIRDNQGQVTGVVLVFHDISEKRRAEKAVRDSERLATTGRLASTLAHEIHNPLDTVGSLLYLVDRTPDVPATVRQHVAMASEELARVTQMTRHMLSFQRESKKPVPIKIGEVLDNVIALYERKIESAGIQVEKQVEFEGEFLGLPGEMRQVFANLVGNAIEAIGKNGKIRLHAYASRDWRRGRRGLRVTVADNGPGIPAEVRDKIFDPFFTTKGESGTGLGLWITLGIVEKNEGKIRLRTVTRDGRSGTCFSVSFPFPRRSRRALPANNHPPK